MTNKKQKKIKYPDNWVLTHDLIEVHFVNDIAIEVKYLGHSFLSPHYGLRDKKLSLPTRKKV